MRAFRAALLVFVVTLALGVTACGSEDREGSVEESAGPTTRETSTTGTTATSTTAVPSGAPRATVKVKETEFEIDPENPHVAEPGVVSFEVRNAGKVPHALGIEGPRGEVETDVIAPGKSATLKADLSRPGSYKWYCPLGDHEQRGMTGKVSVAGGGSSRGGGGSGKSGDAGKRPGAGGGNSGGVY